MIRFQALFLINSVGKSRGAALAVLLAVGCSGPQKKSDGPTGCLVITKDGEETVAKEVPPSCVDIGYQYLKCHCPKGIPLR